MALAIERVRVARPGPLVVALGVCAAFWLVADDALAAESGTALAFDSSTDGGLRAEAPAAESFPTSTGLATYTAAAAGCGNGGQSFSSLWKREALFEDGQLDRLGDAVTKWKEDRRLPITLGAWHWWHVNNGGPYPDGYGIPRLGDTYYYYLTADFERDVSWGDVSQVGAYAHLRFRDGGDPLRAFYSHTAAWFDTAFVWASTDWGLLKAGAIWKRFGLDWDGSWWGPVQYADGYKLDTDWGIAWEDIPAMQDGFKIDRFVQFFFHENAVSGAWTGADPEGVNGSSERNTLVLRMVPTWQLAEDKTLAIGASALVGRIENEPLVSLARQQGVYATSGGEAEMAWAVDATYTRGHFKAFGEVMQSYGVRSPVRYVSGGPSDRLTAALVGFEQGCGPLTVRFSYSVGFDDNPAATNHLFVPGVTLAVSRNLDLHVEYVRQHVRGHAAAESIEFEDGVQILLNWHL